MEEATAAGGTAGPASSSTTLDWQDAPMLG
jgi:hypothetical protein